MTAQTAQEIHRRATAGDGEAQFVLARLFDREGRHDVAVSWLDRAASGGHVGAMTWLGTRLLVGRAADGPAYDAVIHAVFLGFTISMIMAHAPVILPVRGDLVTCIGDRPYQIRMPLTDPSEHEAGGATVGSLQ